MFKIIGFDAAFHISEMLRSNLLKYNISQQHSFENLSKCAPSTFEGERCLYGALTNDIKDLLVAASQINSNLMSRDEFSEHMRRLYEGIYTDFTIKCIGGALKCHKFVLASRIRFFKAKFAAKWKHKHSVICKSELKRCF